MSGQDNGWPPRYRSDAAYMRVRFAWLAAAVAFLVVVVLGGAYGPRWAGLAASFLLGFTVAYGRRSLRRIRGGR